MNAEAQVCVNDFHIFVTVQLLEDTAVLSDASYCLSSEVVHYLVFFTCKHCAVTNTRDSLMCHRGSQMTTPRRHVLCCCVLKKN